MVKYVTLNIKYVTMNFKYVILKLITVHSYLINVLTNLKYRLYLPKVKVRLKRQ